MCGFNNNGPIDFAVRAIAAGAGGQKLATWALEETVRQQEEQAAREHARAMMWDVLQNNSGDA